MKDDDHPKPDQIEGAPHPSEAHRIFGQDPAQSTFLEAYNTGRLHHGWLMTGPSGVGKATLAWRIARFLLATPPQDDGGLFGAPELPTSLDIDPEHPVSRRMMSGAEPGLFTLRRPYDEKAKRLKAQITVDEVRKLKNFFALSATDGGRRVVIVDSADEMNVNAANALLKLLEEPPARTTLLLVSHQPARLLPTIRSRCRELRLGPLSPDDMANALAQAGIDTTNDPAALAELAAGSVGEAVRLENLSGMAIYSELVAIMDTLPRLDRPRALKLAEAAAQRGAEEKRNLMFSLLDTLLMRLARTGVTGQTPYADAAQGEAQMLARLSPTPQMGQLWAQASQETGARIRHGVAVNLDPAALILDTLIKLSKTAGGVPA